MENHEEVLQHPLQTLHAALHYGVAGRGQRSEEEGCRRLHQAIFDCAAALGRLRHAELLAPLQQLRPYSTMRCEQSQCRVHSNGHSRACMLAMCRILENLCIVQLPRQLEIMPRNFGKHMMQM